MSRPGQTYVLLGRPVAHSLSPHFQSAGLRAIGAAESVYLARDVSLAGVRQARDELRGGMIHGANITLPYKVHASTLADRLSSVAEAVGASNTWYRDAGGLIVATNTDVAGVLASLDVFGSVRGRRQAIVLGAGGAARAAIVALTQRYTRVVIMNRTGRKALTLAADLVGRAACGAGVVSVDRWPDGSRLDRERMELLMSETDLVVQATSIGVGGAQEKTPWGRFAWHALPVGACTLDLVYGVKETEFCARSRSHGLDTLDGATMLLHQGAASFSLWTGVQAPIDVMRDALAVALGRRPESIGSRGGSLPA